MFKLHSLLMLEWRGGRTFQGWLDFQPMSSVPGWGSMTLCLGRGTVKGLSISLKRWGIWGRLRMVGAITTSCTPGCIQATTVGGDMCVASSVGAAFFVLTCFLKWP